MKLRLHFKQTKQIFEILVILSGRSHGSRLQVKSCRDVLVPTIASPDNFVLCLATRHGCVESTVTILNESIGLKS